LGKVLLQGKFSLKKGKKIIYLIVGNQLLIFGEKVPKKKNFPFHFYQCSVFVASVRRWNSQSKVQGLDPFGIHSGENLPI